MNAMNVLAPAQEIVLLVGGRCDGIWLAVDPWVEEIPGAMLPSGEWCRATYCRSGRFTAKGRPIFDYVAED